MDWKEDKNIMRIVFVGAGKLATLTAKTLMNHGHEVIIVEQDKKLIEEISKELDCGFINGDGSRPAVLQEAGPSHSDYLLCLTGSDQTNIIASLVGRSLEFKHVVTKIEDPELDHICAELGLEKTIIPTRTTSRFLTDMIEGRDMIQLSSMVKGEARFFAVVLQEDIAIHDLNLPNESRAIYFYREGKFALISEDTKLKKGDEVIIITDSNTITKLKEWWSGQVEQKGSGDTQS
jgi:trk system potassium uptake protein TrkA